MKKEELQLEEYRHQISMIISAGSVLCSLTSMYIPVMTLLWVGTISIIAGNKNGMFPYLIGLTTMSIIVPILWLISTYKNHEKYRLRMVRCKDIEKSLTSGDKEIATFTHIGNKIEEMKKSGNCLQRFFFRMDAIVGKKIPCGAFIISIIITGFGFYKRYG